MRNIVKVHRKQVKSWVVKIGLVVLAMALLLKMTLVRKVKEISSQHFTSTYPIKSIFLSMMRSIWLTSCVLQKECLILLGRLALKLIKALSMSLEIKVRVLSSGS